MLRTALKWIRDVVQLTSFRIVLALIFPSHFEAAFRKPEHAHFGGYPEVSPPGEESRVIFFQTWKNYLLPDNYAHWSASICLVNRHAELYIWDDSDNAKFVSEFFPGLVELWDSLPAEIFRVDMVRPLFLLQFGGSYLDLDCVAVRPLTMARSDGVWLGAMGRDPRADNSIPNATMSSKRGHIFWLIYVGFMIHEIRSRTADQLVADGPVVVTGPFPLRTAYEWWLASTPEARLARAEEVALSVGAKALPPLNDARIRLLPSVAFFALDWNNAVHRLLVRRMQNSGMVLTDRSTSRIFPEAMSVTFWSNSWNAAGS